MASAVGSGRSVEVLPVTNTTATSQSPTSLDPHRFYSSSLDSSSGDLSPRPQRPNRFTSVFQKMKADACPDEIRVYAQCVQEKQELQSNNPDDNDHEGEGLVRHACQAEFQAVKECFKRVRRELRQSKPA